MFSKIIKYFTEKNTITQSATTSSIPVTSSSYIFRYLPQISKCKIHWEYQGMAVPINNCNDCWEYYSQKSKRL